MLLLDAHQIVPLLLRRAHGHAHALARNDVAAEVFEELGEARVAGGLGDGAMEGEVLVDGALAAREWRPRWRVKRLRRWRQAAAGVMRSAASAAASTSMARRSSITSSTSPIELKPSGSMRKGTRLASAATKAPDALPRHHQAFRAQRRHRLAHDGAADAHGRHQLLLGGQARAGRQSAAADFAGNARHHLLGAGCAPGAAAVVEPACQGRARRLGLRGRRVIVQVLGPMRPRVQPALCAGRDRQASKNGVNFEEEERTWTGDR